MAILITSPFNFRLLAVLSLFVLYSSAAAFGEPPEDDDVAVSKVPAHVAQPKILKLERQSVMLPKTAVRAGKRKNFYSSKIFVGEPAQEFHVAFDLGGGTMVLPSKDCTDAACLGRRLYNKWASNSAEDIMANGKLVQRQQKKTLLQRRDRGTIGLHSLDVGSGKVSGTFVRDQVCVYGEGEDAEEDGITEGESRCFPVGMLLASKMTDMPFVLEPYDGTVGLGLKGMSVSTEFNFLAAFHNGYSNDKSGNAFSNSFGLHIGSDGDGGEITFGGYDMKRLTHPLEWAPVADPQEGRWQVSISAIRVGNSTFDACKDRVCRAAIDYSSSLLGVPTNLAAGLESSLAKVAIPSGFGDGCQTLAIPDLHLDLDNGITLTLAAEDFVSDIGPRKAVLLNSPSCNPQVTHNDAEEGVLERDVFVLGESTLRRYYTFFNADTLSVGFSLAAAKWKNSLLTLAEKGADETGDNAVKGDKPVMFLVQVKIVKSKTMSSLGM